MNRHMVPPLMELRQMGETNIKHTYINIYTQFVVNAMNEMGL